MNDTGIIWTNETWNPMSGCVKVSAGCKFCYAEAIAEAKRGTAAFPVGFDLMLRPHKLREPYRLKAPSLIFVNSMSDLFLEQIPDSYRDQVFDVIADTPQHEYQILTKRPGEMLRYSLRRPFPQNVWAGVSVENQSAAETRIPTLLQVEASIRFLSIEPLLGPVGLSSWIAAGLHWVIVGGESGTQVTSKPAGRERALVSLEAGRWVPKPEAVEWVRLLRDQCVAAEVRYFHKQWGGPRPHSGGRLLDGRTWDEMPRLPEGGAENRRLLGRLTTAVC